MDDVPAAEPATRAFTYRDLLATIASVTLLVSIGIPALGNARLRSQRSFCVSNLGLIGKAFNQWAAEHEDDYPILTYYPTGTRNHPFGLNNNLWFQFLWVSNELATPKLLACPSDPRTRAASEFTLSAVDGFMHPFYRNNAVSYFLAWPRPHEGRLMLSGDRMMNPDGSLADFGGITTAYRFDKNSPDLRWLPGIHPDSGNLLFNDGSVEETDSSQLRAAAAADPKEFFGAMMPRDPRMN